MKKPAMQNQPPALGFRVVFPSGKEIKAMSIRRFTSQCYAYMVENDLDVTGDWEARLWEDVCNQNPDIPCDDSEHPEAPLTMRDLGVFKDAMVKWLSSGGEFVSHGLAEKRASVCVTCKNNVHISMGCGTLCSKVMSWFSEKIGVRRTSVDSQLQSCSQCRCYLKFKTLLPVDALMDDGVEYPSWCWIIKERSENI